VSWPVEKILEEAFKEDPEDRALLVAELSSSEGIATPQEVENAWREEIARRVKSLEDGTAVLHDWDEVREAIASILKGASPAGHGPAQVRRHPTCGIISR
jgi:hypothetical protein